ncbi:tRNA-4-demethylwyosine synthase [Aureococcus anophagefferens]|nr:tRNA-4-demethylwyosine synthase [Aureococcus anophagefferens]
MVTPAQAKALKKEGYKLIGSHSAVKLRAGKESEIPSFKGSISAVKLCRWTKHQLRGRGGCYKHTFYGITSYQCMEATPSLACANKCVFCWRHHKNPVGTSWKWKADDPEAIVAEAVDLHVAMIKECRGVPGVVDWRWRDAHTVRHCALSLVGEPIIVGPAPRVARAARGGSAVARLTLVKGHNERDVAGYAGLVALGEPTLVEVKGVTFCGKSDASDLTMENCPWHPRSSPSARPSRRPSRRTTRARRSAPFGVEDYAVPAPPWALFGAAEDGFDPVDSVYKKKANGKSLSRRNSPAVALSRSTPGSRASERGPSRARRPAPGGGARRR